MLRGPEGITVELKEQTSFIQILRVNLGYSTSNKIQDITAGQSYYQRLVNTGGTGALGGERTLW